MEPGLEVVSNPVAFNFISTSNSQKDAWLDLQRKLFFGCLSQISATYWHHKNTNWQAYGQRVQEIEHTLFTSIMTSVTARRLCSKDQNFYEEEYSIVMDWVHCGLSYGCPSHAYTVCILHQGRSQEFPKGGSKFSRCLLSKQKFFAKGNIWLLLIVHTFHCIIIHIIL